MKKVNHIVFVVICFCLLGQEKLNAQNWEIGAMGGTAHYFGDLNMYNSMRYPGANVGLIAKYNIHEYIALRGTVSAAFVHFNDKNSINSYYQARNLSFRSLIGELAFASEFNFFKFKVGSNSQYFTPYAMIGLGVFTYQPRAILDGQKFNLRDYGTEGQINSNETGKNKYSLTQFCIPVGLGMKYWIVDRWIAGFELGYRVTTTDFLDDVSEVYIDPALLVNQTDDATTINLADRSDEVGESIGLAGKQRGDSQAKDGYMFLSFTLTYNIFQDKCPTPKR